MGADPNSCAICDWPASDVRLGNSGLHDGLFFECPRCGRYELVGTEAIRQSYTWSPELKKPLSCAARQAAEGSQPLRITDSNAAELAQPHINTRVWDNQERLLREIARRAKRPQNGAGFSPP